MVGRQAGWGQGWGSVVCPGSGGMLGIRVGKQQGGRVGAGKLGISSPPWAGWGSQAEVSGPAWEGMGIKICKVTVTRRLVWQEEPGQRATGCPPAQVLGIPPYNVNKVCLFSFLPKGWAKVQKGILSQMFPQRGKGTVWAWAPSAQTTSGHNWEYTYTINGAGAGVGWHNGRMPGWGFPTQHNTAGVGMVGNEHKMSGNKCHTRLGHATHKLGKAGG